MTPYPEFIEHFGAQAQWDAIPEYMREPMRLYVESGVPTGSFLEAVLSNDLMGAAARADDGNRDALFAWAALLHNGAPSSCFGSPEAVREWCKVGGLAGLTDFRATA